MWDDICARCALCCYERTITPDEVIIDLSSPCQYLDEDSRLCTVYDDRFTICPRCNKLSLFHAMFSSSLPPSCAYIAWAEKHHIRFRKGRAMVLED